MSPECTKRLDRLGHILNWWDAQVRGAWWLAAALGWITALGLLDILFAVGRFGRVLSALGLLVLVGVTVWRIRLAIKQPFSRHPGSPHWSSAACASRGMSGIRISAR